MPIERKSSNATIQVFSIEFPIVDFDLESFTGSGSAAMFSKTHAFLIDLGLVLLPISLVQWTVTNA